MWKKIVLFFATLFSKIDNFFKERMTATKKQVGEKWGKFVSFIKNFSSKKKTEKTESKEVFLYQVEYYPNDDCVAIHTRCLIPRGGMTDVHWFVNNDKDVHPLYVALDAMGGIDSARSTNGGYTLQVTRASCIFSWDEMIPKILVAVQLTLAGSKKIKAAGKPIHTKENFEPVRKRNFLDKIFDN